MATFRTVVKTPPAAEGAPSIETSIDWKVNLTVGLLTEIKRETGVALANAAVDAEKFVELLYQDPGAIVGALWIVCAEQAAAEGMTAEQFGKLFDGETLDQAVKALLDGSIDFFPKARGRDAIRKGMPRAWQQIEKQVNEQIERNIDSTFSNTVGSLPES